MQSCVKTGGEYAVTWSYKPPNHQSPIPALPRGPSCCFSFDSIERIILTAALQCWGLLATSAFTFLTLWMWTHKEKKGSEFQCQKHLEGSIEHLIQHHICLTFHQVKQGLWMCINSFFHCCDQISDKKNQDSYSGLGFCWHLENIFHLGVEFRVTRTWEGCAHCHHLEPLTPPHFLSQTCPEICF